MAPLFDPVDLKFKLYLGVVGLFIMAIVIARDLRLQKEVSLEYPSLQRSESISDEIKSIWSDRSMTRVEFKGGLKRTFHTLGNRQYTPGDFQEFAWKGDIVLKQANGDTIKLIKEGFVYTFVMNKIIECCERMPLPRGN